MQEKVVKFRMENNKNLNTEIKRLRKIRKMSQTALGNLIGVSYQQVQNYERGTSQPPLDKLDKIAKALGVHISDLTGETTIKPLQHDSNTVKIPILTSITGPGVTEEDMWFVTSRMMINEDADEKKLFWLEKERNDYILLCPIDSCEIQDEDEIIEEQEGVIIKYETYDGLLVPIESKKPRPLRIEAVDKSKFFKVVGEYKKR